MGKITLPDAEPPTIELLSKRRLPTQTLRELHAKLLVSNPRRAQEIWDQWSRTVEETTRFAEPMAKPTLHEIVARIEHRRVVNEVNARPLRRLKPKGSVLRRLLMGE